MVPLLTLFSYPIHKAVSTASLFGLVISIPATLGIFLLVGMFLTCLLAQQDMLTGLVL